MYIDLTLKITPEIMEDAQRDPKKELVGHLGTHFDVMNKEFPLEYLKREGVIFDVSSVKERDICMSDVDLGKVKKDSFVAFYSGYTEWAEYGSSTYFKEHPQLSDELIDALLDKEISIIGVDFGGVRRGAEHTPKDQYCADREVFVIENLVNLKELLTHGLDFKVYTFPLNCTGITGLPCRVVADV